MDFRKFHFPSPAKIRSKIRAKIRTARGFSAVLGFVRQISAKSLPAVLNRSVCYIFLANFAIYAFYIWQLTAAHAASANLMTGGGARA